MARKPSWKAVGLVQKAWETLDASDGRDELARITEINANHLSSINTGKRNLTLPKAEKIARATGKTLLELGAPADLVPEDDRTVYDRLAGLAADVEAVSLTVREGLAANDARLSRIEARLGLEAPPSDGEAGAPQMFPLSPSD